MEHVVAPVLEGELRAVYLFTGAEPILVSRLVDAVSDRVRPHLGLEAFNLTTARGSDSEVVDALGAARTLPMMADRRLVVVRDLHEAPNAFFEALVDYLQHPSETTTLVLAGAGFPKVVKGGKNWKARLKSKLGEALVIEIGDRDVDPRAFAVAHAAQLGHVLDRDAAGVLVELVGTELGTVAREVEKVALHAEAEAQLTVSDVTAAVSVLAEEEVWTLTRGVVARQPEQALGALHRLLAQGESPHRLMGLLVWQLRQVLKLADHLRRGHSEQQIRSSLRMRWSEFQAMRAHVGAHTRGAADTLERAARAHREMNGAKAGAERILEAFVLELAAA